ncbi:MAG TPA: phosphopantetheine-binding protein [Micromonosporaceae bacterium]|nr:phosphopantetheine-binding protein [Micromonosporaceae bacterium]
MTEQATPVSTDLSDEEVRAKVLTVIADMAPKQDVKATTDSVLIQDLGYHSLALMEVAFALEDEFDLDPIDEKTARQITTVGAVQDLVIKKISEKS